MGQQTKAFSAWWLESGAFVPVLLAGNRNHYTWQAAWDFMDVIALRSGWRSDHLPTDAEQIRRSIEHYTMERQNAVNQSSYPSGVEVMNSDVIRIVQATAPKVSVDDSASPRYRIPVGRR
jgi:hypothetical protein